MQETNGTHIGMRSNRIFCRKIIKYIFYVHFLLIALLVVFLIIRGVLSAAHTGHFQPKEWYLSALSSTAVGGIIGFACQAFTRLNPSRTVKATFWLSPLFTCGYGILLVYIGTPGSLAASVIALVSSILQSLYACWVTPRFDHAKKIVEICVAYYPPKVEARVVLSIIASTFYSSFLISGIGGATATGAQVDSLFIFLMLGSYTWTMQTIKNMMQVAVSNIKYMQYASGIEVDFKIIVKNAVKYSMGSICAGSILVPVLTVIRALARSVSLLSGDVDEFMFSCAGCCSGIASSTVAYGNRWGFVHVGLYDKGIVQSSIDTWETFRRVGMEKLIDLDLTSSFCFLAGVAEGSICALVGGTLAVALHKTYATEVSIYAFFTGYLMNRVAMAWVQASVSAYYVAYAENPQSQQFDTTIPDRIQELQRSQV